MFKQRLVTSVILLCFLIPVLIFSHISLLLTLVVAALSVAAVYEVLVASNYIESKALMLVSIFFAFAIPFSKYLTKAELIAVIFIIAVIFFVTLIVSDGFRFEHVAVVFFVSILFPFFFSSILYIVSGAGESSANRFYLWLIFIMSWGCDTGAYLFGRWLGKHKLMPKISPKKTIEGSLGGMLFSCALAVVFSLIIGHFYGVQTHYGLLIAFVLGGTIVSQIGDLSASAIKRTFGVKDFGSIMPGHGGIMDRFDSVMFVAPYVYIISGIVDIFYK